MVYCSKTQERDFFPLNEGMKWEYYVQTTNLLGQKSEGKLIRHVSGSEIVRGKNYYKISDIYSGLSGQPNSIIYYRKDINGVYVKEGRFKNRPEQLFIKFPIEVGSSWKVQFPDITGHTEYNCEIERFKTLKMILKKLKLKNCMKIYREAKDPLGKRKMIEYYAPNIGLVRAIYGWGNVTMILELREY